MIFAFAACGKKAEEQPAEEPVIPGVPSPVTEYSSLEDLNAAYGVHLAGPGAMGVSDESFCGIDCDDYDIAQYKFTIGGYEYCLRCAPALEDISGLWSGEGTIFRNTPDGEEAILSENGYRAARWFNIDGQYCLTVTDEGKMEDGFFEGVVDEIKGVTAPVSTVHDYASLPGEYQDSWSGRATMIVSENGGDSVRILVSWPNSASEIVYWDLTASFAEDGLLYYTGTKNTAVYNEDGTEHEKTLLNGEESGYFSVDENGTIFWNGASEENCLECSFEKMQ